MVTKNQKIAAKPIFLRGSRQVVESAIDASKSSRNRTWDASARSVRATPSTRCRRATQKSCYDE